MTALPKDESPLNYRIRRQLAEELVKMIHTKGLKQREAALLLGTAQSRVSQIVRGHVHDVSIDSLVNMIATLGGDVQVTLVLPSH